MMVTLVVLMAALSALTVGPVSADVACGAAQAIPGATNGNVTAKADLPLVECIIGPGHTVNGNVIATGIGEIHVFGTVNGDIEGNSTGASSVEGGGTLNGNFIMEGGGGLFVIRASVNGNLEQKGSGALQVRALNAASAVSGNVINEGTGLTLLLAQNCCGSGVLGTITVGGNVEAKGGGTNDAIIAGAAASSITVDGSVCGGPPTGYAGAGVTVNGSIDASC